LKERKENKQNASQIELHETERPQQQEMGAS